MLLRSFSNEAGNAPASAIYVQRRIGGFRDDFSYPDGRIAVNCHYANKRYTEVSFGYNLMAANKHALSLFAEYPYLTSVRQDPAVAINLFMLRSMGQDKNVARLHFSNGDIIGLRHGTAEEAGSFLGALRRIKPERPSLLDSVSAPRSVVAIPAKTPRP